MKNTSIDSTSVQFQLRYQTGFSKALLSFLLCGSLISSASAATGTWGANSAGNWSDSTKWASGTIADGASSTANFTFDITVARTVTLDSSRTIGSVVIGDASHAYTIATGSNTLTFNNGASNAALTQNGNGTSDIVSGNLAVGGNGTLVISGSKQFSGFTVSAGITSALASGTQTLSIDNNQSSHTVTLSGVIGDGSAGGKIAVTKTGAGTVTLSGTNTYTGGTTLSVGTINVNSANALGSGALTITGGTLNNSTASAITLATNNAQNWNGSFAFGGTRALNLGTGAVGLGANVTANVGGSGSTALTVGGDISGAGRALTKTGNGTLILSGTNTYDGGTTINGGVLQFNSAGAIAGTGNNLAVNNGGVAAFGFALDQATLTGRIVAGSKGAVALGTDVSTDLDFTATGLTKLSLGAAGGTFTYSGSLWTPADGIYRLGGGDGTLVFNPTLSGSNSLLVGGGSGGTVTLVNAGTYSGGTTVTGGRGSGNAAIGTANGASLLQTNVLSGASTTPFGSNAAITLNNGALGLGTAGTLGSGEDVNAAGYDITYNGQNAINLKAGSGTATLAANTLNRVNNGVLVLNPTSGATLGNTEKVTVASGAPTVTNGMVAPYYINGTTRNFLTYGANGFQDITYSVVGTTGANIASASATDTVVLSNSTFNTTLGGNKAIYALKLVNTSNSFNANALGLSGETLTLLSGGLIIDASAGGGFNFSSDTTRASINFGTAEAVVGVFGASANMGSSAWIGTGGFTLYGTGAFQASNTLITGGVTVAGGTLRYGSTNAINTNNQMTVAKAGTLQFVGTSGQLLGLSGEGLVNNSSGNATLTIDGLTGTGTTTFSGNIQAGAGGVSVTKNGLNTQVLSGTNTYTGATTVNGGTLRLDFSGANAPTTNILNNTANGSALTLGGGKLDIVGASGATNSQQFNGLTVNSGNSSIALTAGAGGGVPTVTLGSTFTRGAGGTLNVDYASGTPISTAATTTTTNGLWNTSGSNPTAFATINGTDWATVSSGNIVAVSSYGTNDFTTANVNADVTSNQSPATFTNANSLRFNTGGGVTLTLTGTNTLTAGGILVTSATAGSGNAATITGGTLKSNAGNELVIINNGQLTVGSVLANGAAASALTLSGSGTTTLNAANSFTGSAYINSGTVVVGNAAAFGTTAGTLNLNGGTMQSASAVTLNAKAVSLNRNFTIGGSNDLTLSGVFTNSSSSNTLTVNNTGATALTGGVVLSGTLNVAGSGNLATSGVISSTGGLTYSGSGTMTLGNAASSYSGVTRVNSGTLSVATLAAGSANSGMGAASNAASNIVLDGGTLKYTGATVSTDRLFSVGGSGGTLDASGSGAVNFTNSGALGFANTPGTRTLTLAGTNTGTNTLNAVVGDHLGLYATSLTKNGTGTWVLSGANTYTGATTVSGGTLLVNGSLGNTTVTVGAAGTLGGSGSFAGAVNIQGTHNPGNSPGIQTFNDLSYSGGASVVNFELKSNTTTNAANPNAVFDSMIVNGDLDFAAATTLNLSFVPLGTDVLWTDTFWDTSKTGTAGWLLYDVAGTTTGFSNLGLASINWLDSGGNAFNTELPGAGFSLYQDGNDIYLNYAAVPEPSTYAMFGLGLLSLWALRRRGFFAV